MRLINYLSDFDFILELKDARGKSVGIPSFDWIARFYTTDKRQAVIASGIQGELVNCFDDSGRLHIVCNNHHLQPGELQVEFSAHLLNDIYPDGVQCTVTPLPLRLKLVTGAGDDTVTADVELKLPLIKGDAGVPGKPDIPMRLLSAAEYDALDEYDDDTLYFIIED